MNSCCAAGNLFTASTPGTCDEGLEPDYDVLGVACSPACGKEGVPPCPGAQPLLLFHACTPCFFPLAGTHVYSTDIQLTGIQ
jgi:hypothetical protein